VLLDAPDLLMERAATNFAACKTAHCAGSPTPAACLLDNCAWQLENCGYVQHVGRVKWFKFSPAAEPDEMLHWEFEVRYRVNDVPGTPWVFVYRANADCEDPLRIQFEVQSVEGGQCESDGQGDALGGIRINQPRLAGPFIVGVGDRINDAEAEGKQFLLRAAYWRRGARPTVCREDAVCGLMSDTCRAGQCILLGPEPEDGPPEFQCMQ
jgi:hypothetical protein